MAYNIDYSTEAIDHLRSLTAAQRATIVAAVHAQLKHQPTTLARNRKPMRSNPLATWKLRVRDLRVFYDVEEEPEQIVFIQAIGIKIQNRVKIGDKEVKL